MSGGDWGDSVFQSDINKKVCSSTCSFVSIKKSCHMCSFIARPVAGTVVPTLLFTRDLYRARSRARRKGEINSRRRCPVTEVSSFSCRLRYGLTI